MPGLLVTLPNVTGRVLLHAHLRGSDGAAERFLDHLDALEAGGVELAAVRPGFWGHVAAAVEVGHAPPWPDAGEEVDG